MKKCLDPASVPKESQPLSLCSEAAKAFIINILYASLNDYSKRVLVLMISAHFMSLTSNLCRNTKENSLTREGGGGGELYIIPMLCFIELLYL